MFFKLKNYRPRGGDKKNALSRNFRGDERKIEDERLMTDGDEQINKRGMSSKNFTSVKQMLCWLYVLAFPNAKLTKDGDENIVDNADTLLKIDLVRLDSLLDSSDLKIAILKEGIKLYEKS